MNPMRRLMRFAKGMMMSHVPGMITCAEFEEFIADYLENRLTPSEKRVFEWHLRMCRDCRSYLAAFRLATDMGRQVLASASEPVPDEVPEDLVSAILAARRAKS